MNNKVLIFSSSTDYSTNEVTNWLRSYNIDFLRFNGDDDNNEFISCSDEGIYYLNRPTNKVVNLLEYSSCWWRRRGLSLRQFKTYLGNNKLKSHKFALYREEGKKIIEREGYILIDYIYDLIYNNCKIKLGSPRFDINRMIVLKKAKEFGLNIPQTSIVTTTQQVKDFELTTAKKNLVTKSLGDGIYDILDDQRFYTYTELLEQNFYLGNKSNFFYPSLISGLIEKDYEVRIFFLSGNFYSKAIFSQNDEETKIDFRKYTNNRSEPFDLPVEIELKLKELINFFSLNTCSIDLIVNKEGEYVFLEINPVGQYGMVSIPCNYSLDEKIAKYLIFGK